MDIRLVPAGDGSYDVIVDFSNDVEFGLDFLSKENLSNGWQKIRDFVKKNAAGKRINMVKLALGGVIVGSMLFSSLGQSTLAGPGGKYAMSYFNGGTVTQQMNWVANTGDSLDMVSPSYFDINSDGSLKLNTVNKTLVDNMHAQGIDVVPYLSNHWVKATGNAAMLNCETLSTQVAQAIEQYNLDGVNVDIENVGHEYRDYYTLLVQRLREKIPAKKEVSVAVAANPNGWTTGWHGSYDYAGLAKYADHLVIMAYDEHWEGGSAGPVASRSFVEKSIKYALGKVSANKIVVALPFFGRIWGGNGTLNGQGLTLNRAEQLRVDYNGVINYDQAAQSPVLTFTVNAADKQNAINGITLKPGVYTVWYENDESLKQKVDLLTKYDLKGSGAWALGGEPVSYWGNYTAWLTGGATQTTPLPTPQPTPQPTTQPTPQPTTKPTEQEGWVKEGGIWRYYEKGAAATGWRKIGSAWYYFLANGNMATGWQQVGGKWYYLTSSGAMATGWQKVGNNWYLLSGSGAMLTGWQQVGGKWYYLTGSGAMATGWQKVGKSWYLLSGSGAMLTGWQQVGGKWYYLSGSGAMVTGSQTINGRTYKFDSNGVWIP